MASRLREKRISAVVVTAADMTAEVKSGYKSENGNPTPTEIIQKYSKFDLLLIDEVGVQTDTEAEKRIFFDVINKRYEAVLPTVMISNLAVDELSKFVGERAMDRMRENSGMVIAFGWDSHRR
jgi:DNA replication protein DnaC